MTNDQFRKILYNIRRRCDEHQTAFDLRVTKVALEVDNALEVLSQEIDTALTAEREIVYEENGDRLYA